MSGGPDTPASGVPAPAAQPASPAPVAAVAAPEAVSSPAAVPAPVAAPIVPAVEPTPVTPAAEPVKPAEPAKPEPTSLLSEPKPAEPAPAADGAQPAEPAPVVLPSYEFKAPEGIELAPEQAGKFNELLGAFEQATGGDHMKFGEHGQKLIDFHFAEMQRVHEANEQASRDGWETLRDGWRTEFRADPDLGGAREASTLANCASIIDQFGGNASQRADLRKWMAVTGLGDHPHMIRLLNNIAKVTGESKPVPAVTPAKTPTRSSRRYANTTNGAS